MSDSHDGNNMFAGLLGVGYRWPLIFGHLKREVVPAAATGQPAGAGQGNGSAGGPRTTTRLIYPRWTPYFGVAGDLVIADVHDLADNIHSGVRCGGSGDAFLGISYLRRGFVEVRYRLMSDIKSFDFSGLSISAGYRIRL